MGPITIETILSCLLQWIGGGNYPGIRLCAGISPAGFIDAYTSALM